MENSTFQKDNVPAIHNPLFITVKLQFIMSQGYSLLGISLFSAVSKYKLALCFRYTQV